MELKEKELEDEERALEDWKVEVKEDPYMDYVNQEVNAINNK